MPDHLVANSAHIGPEAAVSPGGTSFLATSLVTAAWHTTQVINVPIQFGSSG